MLHARKLMCRKCLVAANRICKILLPYSRSRCFRQKRQDAELSTRHPGLLEQSAGDAQIRLLQNRVKVAPDIKLILSQRTAHISTIDCGDTSTGYSERC